MFFFVFWALGFAFAVASTSFSFLSSCVSGFSLIAHGIGQVRQEIYFALALSFALASVSTSMN